MKREEAFEILKKYMSSESLLKHSFAVEGSMRGLARKYNEDVEKWSIVGLLHDIDYEKYPDTHPEEGQNILKEENIEEEIRVAIYGHAKESKSYRESLMAKALFAVDELSSFIVACALVRPSKSFEDLELKSVKKKLKDKGFAKGVNREIIKESSEELGLESSELITEIIEALRVRERELNLEGYSLL